MGRWRCLVLPGTRRWRCPLLVSPRVAEVEDTRRDALVEEVHRAVRRGREEVPLMDRMEAHAGRGGLAGVLEDRQEDRRIGRQEGRRAIQVGRGAPRVDRRPGRVAVSKDSPVNCRVCCGRWSMCNGSWQSRVPTETHGPGFVDAAEGGSKAESETDYGLLEEILEFELQMEWMQVTTFREW